MTCVCLFNLMLRLVFFSSPQKKSFNYAKKKLLGHCHLNDEVVVPVAEEKIIVLIQTQPHL